MVRDSIEQLHSKYKTSLASKAEILTNLRQEATKSGAAEDYESLRANLHKLAGSAGMYGYDDISQLAQQIINKFNEEQSSQDLIFDNLQDLIDLLTRYYNEKSQHNSTSK